MKFRRTLFTILALLALAWIVYGLFVSAQATSETIASAETRAGTNTEAFQAGAAIGGTAAVTFFICSGAPFLLIFGLLAWRNGVGIQNERRHQETLAAMQAKGSGSP